jgi:hypothetical protein
MKNITMQEFAKSLVDDPAYRDTIRLRALAGTLPTEIEMMVLELAQERVPMTVPDDAPQSRTLALIRPSVFKS